MEPPIIMSEHASHPSLPIRWVTSSLAALAVLLPAARSQAGGEASRARAVEPPSRLMQAEPAARLLEPDTAASRVDRHTGAELTPGVDALRPVPPSVVSSMRRDPCAIQHMEGTDGSCWVRGASYKASFGPEGAVFIPFLGSAAPQNYPVRMSLAHVTVGGTPLDFEPAVDATRNGSTIALDRGALLERYETGLESIEQTFVFEELPQRGEIVLRIAVESELAGREDPGALVFENALGGVRYGRATALDARGQSTPASTTWTGSGIEIRVPADFVASAHLPLVIDPWVQGFSITWGSLDESLPDVAFDATTGRWIVVYEEVFSASDHDVIRLLYSYDGTGVLFSAYVDASPTEYWANPAVANNHGTSGFLVVAEVGNPSAGQRVIRGRIVAASTGTLGANLLISDALSGEKVNPDVGGDSYPSPDPNFSGYLVVWQRNRLSTDLDIHGRYVSASGGLNAAFAINATLGTQDQRPSISKVARPITMSSDTRWVIAWERFIFATPPRWDIHGAIVSYPDTISTPSFAIDTSTLSNDRYPDVSSPRSDGLGNVVYLVANQRDSGAEHDIIARLMTNSASTDVVNLTALEDAAGAGNLLLDQAQPSTDLVSSGWVVASSEMVSGSATTYDLRMSTLSVVNDQLLLGESRLSIGPVSSSSTPDGSVSVAATWPGLGDPRRCLMVYHDATGGAALGNIGGLLYDSGQYTSFCHPGSDGVLACPCANPPASAVRGCDNGSTGGAILFATGVASLSNDDLILRTNGELSTALSIFNQGTAISSPAGIVFGQGVRCVGGFLKRLYTKTASGGAASAPGASDPNVHLRSAALGDTILAGSPRYYYVYYRQPNVLSGCPPGTATYNSTQSLMAVWAP